MQTHTVDPALIRSIQKTLLKDDIEAVKALNESMLQSKKSFIIWSILFVIALALCAGGVLWGIDALSKEVLNEKELFQLYLGVGAFGAFIFVMFLVKWSKKSSATKAFKTYKSKKSVTKVSTSSMPLKTYHGSNGTYIHDDSGHTKPVTLDFYAQSNIDRLETLVDRYKTTMENMPEVLNGHEKSEHTLDNGNTQAVFAEESTSSEILHDAITAMENLDAKEERFNFLQLNAQELTQLENISTHESLSFEPVVATKEASDMSHSIKQIEGDLFHDDQGPHQYMKEVSTNIATSLDSLAKERQKSIKSVVQPMNTELKRISLITSYNCYCPSCNEDVLKNIEEAQYDGSLSNSAPTPSQASLLTPLADGKTWECPMCSKQTQNPFAVHKMLDKLIYPTMDRLIQENKNERTKLYHNAESEKRKILTDERKEVRDLLENGETRTDAIQSRVRDMVANMANANGTIKLLMGELASFQLTKEGRLKTLSNEMAQITDKIEEHRTQSITKLNTTLDEIKDEATQEFSRLASIARAEEQARVQLMKDQVNTMKEVKSAVHQNTSAVRENTRATQNVANSMQANTRATQNVAKSMKANTAAVGAQTQQQHADASDIKFNQTQMLKGSKADKNIFGDTQMRR